jgi:hypothetical protein
VTRVYLPARPEELSAWATAGLVPAAAERVLAESEDEQDEYAALMTAADLADPARRIVVVAEVIGDGEGEIGWPDVVAVHADPVPRPADADPDEDLAWFATQDWERLTP